MANELMLLQSRTGLAYDDRHKMLHGVYQEYHVAIKDLVNTRRYLIVMPVKFSNESLVQPIEQFLQQTKQQFSMIDVAQYKGNSIIVGIRIKGLKKNAAENILPILNTLIQYCQQSHFFSCCEQCGQTYLTHTVSVDGIPNILCDTCYNDMLLSIDQIRANNKAKKSNYFAGIVGALLGSLAGAVLWIIIYQLGYIAAIAGLVSLVCAVKLYEKFAGKLNAFGIIISIIASIIMLLIAENICVAIELYRSFNSYGIPYDFFECFRLVPEMLQEPEVRKAVIGDMVLGYLLMGIASIQFIIKAFRNPNDILGIEKIEKVERNNFQASQSVLQTETPSESNQYETPTIQ